MDYYKMSIEEIEDYIIGKKVKDMSLEEIRKLIENQGELIVMKDKIIEKYTNKVNKAIEFVEKEHNTYPSAEEWRKALLQVLKR